MAIRVSHAFGRHAWIDVEDWEPAATEDGYTIVSIIGQRCWLCPAHQT